MSEATDLVELLRKIGIRASREAIEAWLVHAAKTKASPAQITEQLCTLEQREREVRNLARRAKIAALGTPKALDRFDWNHPRAIDRELFDQLHSSLDFIRRGENVLLRGQAGVGKTTLAQTVADDVQLADEMFRSIRMVAKPTKSVPRRAPSQPSAFLPAGGDGPANDLVRTWSCRDGTLAYGTTAGACADHLGVAITAAPAPAGAARTADTTTASPVGLLICKDNTLRAGPHACDDHGGVERVAAPPPVPKLLLCRDGKAITGLPDACDGHGGVDPTF